MQRKKYYNPFDDAPYYAYDNPFYLSGIHETVKIPSSESAKDKHAPKTSAMESNRLPYNDAPNDSTTHLRHAPGTGIHTSHSHHAPDSMSKTLATHSHHAPHDVHIDPPTREMHRANIPKAHSSKSQNIYAPSANPSHNSHDIPIFSTNTSPSKFFKHMKADDLILIALIIIMLFEDNAEKDFPLIIALAFLLLSDFFEF